MPIQEKKLSKEIRTQTNTLYIQLVSTVARDKVLKKK